MSVGEASAAGGRSRDAAVRRVRGLQPAFATSADMWVSEGGMTDRSVASACCAG